MRLSGEKKYLVDYFLSRNMSSRLEKDLNCSRFSFFIQVCDYFSHFSAGEKLMGCSLVPKGGQGRIQSWLGQSGRVWEAGVEYDSVITSSILVKRGNPQKIKGAKTSEPSWAVIRHGKFVLLSSSVLRVGDSKTRTRTGWLLWWSGAHL